MASVAEVSSQESASPSYGMCLEAISSRPLLLHDVAMHTQQAGQTHLTITSLPAKQVGHITVLPGWRDS